MATDTWYVDVNNDTQYAKNNEHKTMLAITQEAVYWFKKTQPISYPDKTLLYSYNAANQHSLQRIQDNDYQPSITTAIEPGSSVELPGGKTATGQYLTNVFCYQVDNVAYIAGQAKDSDSAHYEIVYKLEPGSTSATPYCYSKIQIPDPDYNDEFSITALSVEAPGNVLYGMTKGKFGAGTYFPKLFTYDPSVEGTKTQFYEGSIRTHQKVSCFVLKDGCVYVPDYDSGKLTITCYLLNWGKLEEISSKSKLIMDFSQPPYNIPHFVEITDMICMGNDIYILLNDTYKTVGELNSRGKLIKYNLEAETFGILATEESMFETIQYYCSGKNDEIIDLFEDITKVGPGGEYKLDVPTSIYTPQTYTNQFYGPQKILSYNDSYLYIADSGISYIIDFASDNQITFEPVNRIVKVDIHNDNMAFAGVIDVEENMSFTVSPTTIFLIL